MGCRQSRPKELVHYRIGNLSITCDSKCLSVKERNYLNNARKTYFMEAQNRTKSNQGKKVSEKSITRVNNVHRVRNKSEINTINNIIADTLLTLTKGQMDMYKKIDEEHPWLPKDQQIGFMNRYHLRREYVGKLSGWGGVFSLEGKGMGTMTDAQQNEMCLLIQDWLHKESPMIMTSVHQPNCPMEPRKGSAYKSWHVHFLLAKTWRTNSNLKLKVDKDQDLKNNTAWRKSEGVLEEIGRRRGLEFSVRKEMETVKSWEPSFRYMMIPPKTSVRVTDLDKKFAPIFGVTSPYDILEYYQSVKDRSEREMGMGRAIITKNKSTINMQFLEKLLREGYRLKTVGDIPETVQALKEKGRDEEATDLYNMAALGIQTTNALKMANLFDAQEGKAQTLQQRIIKYIDRHGEEETPLQWDLQKSRAIWKEYVAEQRLGKHFLTTIHEWYNRTQEDKKKNTILLYGASNAGKSYIGKLLEGLTTSVGRVNGNQSNPTFVFQSCVGVRIIIIEETRIQGGMEDTFKGVCGGDAVKVGKKHCPEDVEILPTPVMWTANSNVIKELARSEDRDAFENRITSYEMKKSRVLDKYKKKMMHPGVLSVDELSERDRKNNRTMVEVMGGLDKAVEGTMRAIEGMGSRFQIKKGAFVGIERDIQRQITNIIAEKIAVTNDMGNKLTVRPYPMHATQGYINNIMAMKGMKKDESLECMRETLDETIPLIEKMNEIQERCKGKVKERIDTETLENREVVTIEEIQELCEQREQSEIVGNGIRDLNAVLYSIDTEQEGELAWTPYGMIMEEPDVDHIPWDKIKKGSKRTREEDEMEMDENMKKFKNPGGMSSDEEDEEITQTHREEEPEQA